MRSLICILTLVLLSVEARAADWSVRDLGRVYKEQHCMEAAARTFRAMLGEVRIARLHRNEWVTYADEINGDHDALITCTYGDNRGTRATLVMHSESKPIDAHRLARRIAAVFNAQAKRITKAWKDSFNEPS